MKIHSLLIPLLFSTPFAETDSTSKALESRISEMQKVIEAQAKDIDRLYTLFSDQNNGVLGLVGNVGGWTLAAVGAIAALLITISLLNYFGHKREFKLEVKEVREENTKHFDEFSKKVSEQQANNSGFIAEYGKTLEKIKDETIPQLVDAKLASEIEGFKGIINSAIESPEKLINKEFFEFIDLTGKLNGGIISGKPHDVERLFPRVVEFINFTNQVFYLEKLIPISRDIMTLFTRAGKGLTGPHEIKMCLDERLNKLRGA